MSAIRYFYTFMVVILISAVNPVKAETSLKPFGVGSYQQLLAAHANQPFMLVIWSLTCPSCLKDMALLNKLHQDKPTVKIVMLATDDSSESAQVQSMLAKNNLQSVENWIYAEENTQKLNYAIDPNWFGELPRTYFFDAKHQRTGVSGVIKEAEYLQMFEKFCSLKSTEGGLGVKSPSLDSTEITIPKQTVPDDHPGVVPIPSETAGLPL